MNDHDNDGVQLRNNNNNNNRNSNIHHQNRPTAAACLATTSNRNSNGNSNKQAAAAAAANASPSSNNKKHEGDSMNVQVAVRCRGLNEREKAGSAIPIAKFYPTQKVCTIRNPRDARNSGDDGHVFTFDQLFWSAETPDAEGGQPAGQQRVYEIMGKPLLDNAFSGLNSCLFAYGQTSSGKTWTMLGGDMNDPSQWGILPRLCQGIFERTREMQQQQIEQASGVKSRWTIKVGYVEVYNERVSDLLAERKKDARTGQQLVNDVFREVREDPKTGVFVEGQTLIEVESSSEMLELMEMGSKQRHIAATDMNHRSSRSHSIFQVMLKEEREMVMTQHGSAGAANAAATTTGGMSARINLIDLAGSERVSQSGVEGKQFEQMKCINLSLTTLGRVIDMLAEMSKNPNAALSKPPYRESKLTYLLKDSLGGNSKTFMIAAISPSEMNLDETLSTLRYASRARDIVNVVKVNEDPRARHFRETQLQHMTETHKKLLDEAAATHQQQLVSLAAQHEALNNKLDSANQQQQQTVTALETEKQQHADARDRIKKLESEKRAAAYAAAAAQEHNNNMVKQIAEQQQQHKESLAKTSSDFQSQLESLQKQLAAEKLARADVDKKLAAANKKSVADQAALQHQLDAATKERDDTKQKLAVAAQQPSAQRADQHRKLDESKQKHNSEKAAALASHAQRLTNDKAQLESGLRAAREELAQAQTAANQKTAANQLEAKLAETTAQLERARADLETAAASQHASQSELSSKINELQQQLSAQQQKSEQQIPTGQVTTTAAAAAALTAATDHAAMGTRTVTTVTPSTRIAGAPATKATTSTPATTATTATGPVRTNNNSGNTINSAQVDSALALQQEFLGLLVAVQELTEAQSQLVAQYEELLQQQAAQQQQQRRSTEWFRVIAFALRDGDHQLRSTRQLISNFHEALRDFYSNNSDPGDAIRLSLRQLREAVRRAARAFRAAQFQLDQSPLTLVERLAGWARWAFAAVSAIGRRQRSSEGDTNNNGGGNNNNDPRGGAGGGAGDDDG